MLPKFTRSNLKNTQLSIGEYHEVCVMIKLQHLSKYEIKFCFIIFTLKDNTISDYSMPTDFVTS